MILNDVAVYTTSNEIMLLLINECKMPCSVLVKQ